VNYADTERNAGARAASQELELKHASNCAKRGAKTRNNGMFVLSQQAMRPGVLCVPSPVSTDQAPVLDPDLDPRPLRQFKL
jgi:hypothetical protein